MALPEVTEAPKSAAAGGAGVGTHKASGLVGATLGAFLGGPVGSALGGYAGQAIADYVSPQARALREQSRKDVAALQQGKLGLSETEKRSMLAGTQRALQAQTAGVEANLRRQAAAIGGFGRSGAQTNALRGIAAAQGEQLAKTASDIDRLSQQTAENRFATIMGRLQGKRAEQLQTGVGLAQQLAQTPASVGTYANYAAAGRKRALEGGLPSTMGAASTIAEEERRKAEQQMRGGQ